MNIEQVTSLIKSHIYQSQEGLSKENPKFDFKRQWYNLKDEKDIFEFLKDTSAIANTVGLDGYIVIGYDEKTSEFFDSIFSNSGLRDTNEISGILMRRIDEPFDINTFDIEIDNHKLSVIHIPPSFYKPHVIKKYKKFDNKGILKSEEDNKVFVRKNTSCVSATKYDIEMMFYDRKNIIPDYDITCNLNPLATNFRPDNTILTSIVVENIGRRSIAINEIILEIEVSESRIIVAYSQSKLNKINIIVEPNKIYNDPDLIFNIKEHIELKELFTTNQEQIDFIKEKVKIKEIRLSNGKVISNIRYYNI